MVAHYGFEQRQPKIHSLRIQPSPLVPRHVWCRCLSCEMSLAARSEDGRLYSQAMKFRMAIYTVRSYAGVSTGNPGSVIVPQYGSSKITVFVGGKNIILKFLGNTK